MIGLIVGVISLAFLIAFIVLCYFKFIKKKCKKKSSDIESITATELAKTEISHQDDDIFFVPSNKENADKNYDLNNFPKQENAYCEPPKLEN